MEDGECVLSCKGTLVFVLGVFLVLKKSIVEIVGVKSLG